ncbi:MAG: fatty acid cis/trans isomerase [Halioglobus sp.]
MLAVLSTPALTAEDYPPGVKEIVERRCVVCHGCYDAPCQLKLDAWEGLRRGASKDKVYDGTRLRTASLTRLFEDAQSIESWREKGFYPVVDGADPKQSVLYNMLELKQQHPLPSGERLPQSFDLSLDRDQQCVKQEEFGDYADNYPLWGMPYALPALDAEKYRTLKDWVLNGAPGGEVTPASADELATVARWEAFFNGSSLKEQLMSRYMYEHLFIGNLYFPELPSNSGYYRLVRSHTPPGQAVEIIATRRPYDSPGEKKFYYRLQPLQAAVVDKRHMPYALDGQRMQRWTELFLEPDYTVSELPSYATKVASNPFVAFRDLPQIARYKFMLDEAQFTIMGFIKGPVCRGQVALNVIDDHFWVVFTEPDAKRAQHSAEFLARESSNLRLPSGKSGLIVSLVQWHSYAKGQLAFLKAKADFLAEQTAPGGTNMDLDLVWDGDGHNDNASLTIFRHNDSASVVKGFVGQQPKTAWLIDYSLLERIHYLLVAGFDVYGNVGHQLETRLYMDFLRMEGEQNFLYLLPRQERSQLRDFWYRNAGDHVKRYVLADATAFDRETDIDYQPDIPPKRQLLGMLAQHAHGAEATRYRVDSAALKKLHKVSSPAFSFMPQVAFISVFDDHGNDEIYSLLHNNAFSNNAQIFGEEKRRIPVEDTLTVASGFIGSYPNLFFHLHEKELPAFSDAIMSLESEADYAQLVSRYGVRRTAPWFWKVSDKLHDQNITRFSREAALFDLNRYENR